MSSCYFASGRIEARIGLRMTDVSSILPISRVEGWRAGLGRSLCSRFARPFVCECHSISTMPRFQSPPRRTNALCGFPACTLTCLIHLKSYGTYPAGATFG
jgi:hypothetical protein